MDHLFSFYHLTNKQQKVAIHLAYQVSYKINSLTKSTKAVTFLLPQHLNSEQQNPKQRTTKNNKWICNNDLQPQGGSKVLFLFCFFRRVSFISRPFESTGDGKLVRTMLSVWMWRLRDGGQWGAWEGFGTLLRSRECIVLWPKFRDLEMQK